MERKLVACSSFSNRIFYIYDAVNCINARLEQNLIISVFPCNWVIREAGVCGLKYVGEILHNNKQLLIIILAVTRNKYFIVELHHAALLLSFEGSHWEVLH